MFSNFAHVKWFLTDNPSSEPALSAADWALVVLIVVLGMGVFSYVHNWMNKKKINKQLDDKLKPMRPLVPLVVRLSTAALLIINATQGYLLAPNVLTTDSSVSDVITLLFVVAAALIGFGILTRPGVLALLAGYLLVLTEADFFDVMDHFEYVAIAGYLWLRGPGVWSIDRYLVKGKLVLADSRKYALDVYRIGVGVGLATLALSEKLFNVSASQDFLNQYDWNFLSAVGVSDRLFIIVAGSIELLVGLALIFNKAPRVLITVVLMLMVITALLLGIEEIYGHLFAVGAVAILWVNDQKPKARD